MSAKGGKKTHRPRVPSLSPRADSRTARILSTTFYSSNASNKHCSYKCPMCLVNLSTQQDTDSMNIPLFLTNPWHIRACWRRGNVVCTGRVLYIRHWCLLCPSTPAKGSTSHSHTAAEITHSSVMPAGEKDSVWPHLSHQVLWVTSSKYCSAAVP